MSDDALIRVEGLWKRYGLPVPDVLDHGRRWLSSAWRGRRSSHDDPRSDGRAPRDDGPWALRDVSLEVRRGETVGIIGRNGAGKSTLLKVLAGVSPATRGRVDVRGSVFPMIELNAGVHPDLTGRENVGLLGAIMGLSRRDLRARLPEIEEFTDLGEWFDRPVRTYSSGMHSRLGFGVATHIESDVLLIDETLAVGDLRFQNRGLARLQQLREGGSTIVLVTHNLETLRFAAQRGIVLDEGMVVAEGPIGEALSAYEGLMLHSERERFRRRVRRRMSTGEVTLYGARVYGQDGESVTDVRAGSPFGVEIEFLLHRSLEHPIFTLTIVNATGIVCVQNASDESGEAYGSMDGRSRLRVWYPENRLVKGAYEVRLGIRDGGSLERLERVAAITSFAVVGKGRGRGIVAMPPRWEPISLANPDPEPGFAMPDPLTGSTGR